MHQKKFDYDRVKILFRYGYRLEQKDNMTDPLKKIELFKEGWYAVAKKSNTKDYFSSFLTQKDYFSSFLTFHLCLKFNSRSDIAHYWEWLKYFQIIKSIFSELDFLNYFIWEAFQIFYIYYYMHTTTNPQAIASPAYIVASLENLNEVSADFFCPIKKCFEFASEANFRKSTIPEYKREYEDIENRYWKPFFQWYGFLHVQDFTWQLFFKNA